MHNFVHEMLHHSPAAQRIEALWQVQLSLAPVISKPIFDSSFQEYEDQLTPEARFVKGTNGWSFV